MATKFNMVDFLVANEGEENSSVLSPGERLHTASDPSEEADCNGMTGCLKGDHQRLCDGLIPRPRKKPLLRKKKKKKWDRSTR
jgi:hypothetical protein